MPGSSRRFGPIPQVLLLRTTMTWTRCARMRAQLGASLTMYEAHFGLRRRPFPATPDCQCWYPSTGHECAVAHLLQAVQDCEGLLLLTGGPGTGKTVLGQRLLEQLGQDVEAVFLT